MTMHFTFLLIWWFFVLFQLGQSWSLREKLFARYSWLKKSAKMIRNNLRSYHYERLTNIRRWQVHSGFNHFCFDGHCVTGRNLSAAVTVIVLLSSTYFIWLLIEVPVLIRTLNSRLVLFIGLPLMFYTYSYGKSFREREVWSSDSFSLYLVYFFRSMCSDPGIILKPTSIEQSAATNDFKPYQITSNSQTEINYAIPINEILVKCKYCVTCQLIRPPRASHCAICSNCVSVLDHHCPFLNTCVGMRNYRFFIWFLVSLLLTALFLFASSTIKVDDDY